MGLYGKGFEQTSVRADYLTSRSYVYDCQSQFCNIDTSRQLKKNASLTKQKTTRPKADLCFESEANHSALLTAGKHRGFVALDFI